MRHSVPSVQSRSQHTFALSPQATIPRAAFNRSHGHKTTFNAGYLIPVFVDEVLPGDTFNLKMTAFARIATLLFPIMDNMYLETFWFYVPNRLVWTNFVKQQGEQANPGDSTDFTTPVIDSTTIAANSAVGSLWDNFGLPMKTGKANLTQVNALPFRMYNMVWREWFRDQDLDDPFDISQDSQVSFVWSAWEKDYFTSSLPWQQRGQAPALPISGTVSAVWGFDQNINFPDLATGTAFNLQARQNGPALVS